MSKADAHRNQCQHYQEFVTGLSESLTAMNADFHIGARLKFTPEGPWPAPHCPRTDSHVQVSRGRKQYRKKNRKRSLFPIISKPPLLPPHLSSVATPLHACSLSTCIVLAEVKPLDILMPLFKQACSAPGPCSRNTMKYIFCHNFFLFFFPAAARQFVAAVLSLSQEIQTVFFSQSSSSFLPFLDVTLPPSLNPLPVMLQTAPTSFSLNSEGERW